MKRTIGLFSIWPLIRSITSIEKEPRTSEKKISHQFVQE
jgi:hypothetical protein